MQPGLKPVMNWRNKTVTRRVTQSLLLLIFLAVAGCSDEGDSFIKNEINPQINVSGIQLIMDESKVHEMVGSKGEKAMCVYGYEYGYTDQHINIGFNSQTKQVRRVTTHLIRLYMA